MVWCPASRHAILHAQPSHPTRRAFPVRRRHPASRLDGAPRPLVSHLDKLVGVHLPASRLDGAPRLLAPCPPASPNMATYPPRPACLKNYSPACPRRTPCWPIHIRESLNSHLVGSTSYLSTSRPHTHAETLLIVLICRPNFGRAAA